MWIEQIPNVIQYFQHKQMLTEDIKTELSIIISNLMQYTSYQVVFILLLIYHRILLNSENNFVSKDRFFFHIQTMVLLDSYKNPWNIDQFSYLYIDFLIKTLTIFY
jgi:hypothetical protein